MKSSFRSKQVNKMSNSSPTTRSSVQILVWDVPVRVFHWLLVLCFAGAWLTAESERWRQIHVTLGYTMAGLVAFRVVWGFLGTWHARFKSFVRGPSAVTAYLKSLVGRNPQHFIGHNPAGALAIVGLLALIVVVTISGWAIINDIGGKLFEEAHEVGADALLALVIVHVLGVIASSLLHRENLVRSMVTGRKNASNTEEIYSDTTESASKRAPRTWATLGAVILLIVVGFWVWEWINPPVVVSEATEIRMNPTEKHP